MPDTKMGEKELKELGMRLRSGSPMGRFNEAEAETCIRFMEEIGYVVSKPKAEAAALTPGKSIFAAQAQHESHEAAFMPGKSIFAPPKVSGL